MKKNVRALPLKLINFGFLVFIGILCLAMVILAGLLSIQFRHYAKTSDQYTEVSLAALNLQEGSDYLTEQCRLFVLSQNIIHLNNYFTEIKETRRREKSLDRLMHHNVNPASIEFLQQAMKGSLDLEQEEFYAMRLVCDGKHFSMDPEITLPEEISGIVLKDEDAKLSDQYKISKAWLLLFSQNYISQKHEISSLKSQAIKEIFEYSEDTHRQSFAKLKIVFIHMISCIAAIFVFVLIFFLCVIFLVFKPLYKFISNIKEDEKLSSTHTKEFNILGDTYNSMFERNEANEILLRHKAEHDELTGLINRSAFTQIKKALAFKEDNIALFIIDVDFFKVINDSYGHSTGDKVLQLVANVLLENFRTTDYVCRIGGDEFVVILTKCEDNQEKTKKLIASKMEAIRDTLKQTKGDLPSVSISCGIALSSTGYNEFLYDKADNALYEVKRSGRDGYAFNRDDIQFNP